MSRHNYWSVKTFRAVGLEAKWDRDHYRVPFIKVSEPNGIQWHRVTKRVSEVMEEYGILEGYHKLFGKRCVLQKQLGTLVSKRPKRALRFN